MNKIENEKRFEYFLSENETDIIISALNEKCKRLMLQIKACNNNCECEELKNEYKKIRTFTREFVLNREDEV